MVQSNKRHVRVTPDSRSEKTMSNLENINTNLNAVICSIEAMPEGRTKNAWLKKLYLISADVAGELARTEALSRIPVTRKKSEGDE